MIQNAIQQTSLFAYRNDILPNLGQRQQEVLKIFKDGENYTNNEIAHILFIPINTVTPRVNELRKLNVVILSETRACKITGRTCCAWSRNPLY